MFGLKLLISDSVWVYFQCVWLWTKQTYKNQCNGAYLLYRWCFYGFIMLLKQYRFHLNAIFRGLTIFRSGISRSNTANTGVIFSVVNSLYTTTNTLLQPVQQRQNNSHHILEYFKENWYNLVKQWLLWWFFSAKNNSCLICILMRCPYLVYSKVERTCTCGVTNITMKRHKYHPSCNSK